LDTDVKAVATTPIREIRQAVPAPAPRTTGNRFRTWLANFWLRYLFWHAWHVPWVVRATKWFYLSFALTFSKAMKHGTQCNAKRILGPDLSQRELSRFTRHVVSNFYDFIYDIGRSLGSTRQQLLERIEMATGVEQYNAVRKSKRGAIVVTAHMGSFEVGVASLLDREPNVHVVFRRDLLERFEMMRARLRENLGVREVPMDQSNWAAWMPLRDALLRDEVVVMQGDRVMPGQKGRRVPFLGGHLLLPTGPIKLSLATGAAVIPVFSIRTRQGRIRLFIEDAIDVDPNDPDAVDHGLEQMARVIEQYVRKYPEQWLVLQPAFLEDALA
jgi:KDO2-lipid IV(A) lauroyltransferase